MITVKRKKIILFLVALTPLHRSVGLEEMQTEMERRAEQIRAEDVCYSAMEIENTVKAKALQAEFNRLERAVEGKEEMVERLDRRIREIGRASCRERV